MTISKPEDAVAELRQVLADAGARPRLDRSRMAPSTLYDADYHVAVVACALKAYSPRRGTSTTRVLAAWIKLMQFLAARPILAENFREYVRTRRDGDLEKWSLMPRGYLGDRTHDSVIELLVASSILRRDGDYLEPGARFDVLTRLHVRIEREGLFKGERNILTQLQDVTPTKALLEGP